MTHLASLSNPALIWLRDKAVPVIANQRFLAKKFINRLAQVAG
jgi:hypothetical protein